MASISTALEAALKHHQAGNLGEAERLYREILDRQARHADAWHLLGLVDYARGDFQAALEHIGRAIELDPQQASFHNHLAEAYRALTRWQQAEASCRKALELKPDFAIAHNTLGTILDAQGETERASASYRQAITLKDDFAQAHYNLALTLESRGQLDEAEASFRRAIERKPDYPLALHRLGVLLQQQSRLDEAIDCHQRVLAFAPDYVEAHCNLGSALKDLGRNAEAIASYRRAITLDPKLAEAHFNLAVVYQSQGELAAAEDAYRQALGVRPNHPETYNNLGTLCRLKGDYAEAVKCFERALEYRPDFGEALSNLGNVFLVQGRRAEALICYDQSLRMLPDYAQAHMNRALALLAHGKFAEGWPEYEWRWKCPTFPQHTHAAPRWEGDPLDGRTLLVHAEQGFGDTLQFVRYLPQLASRGGQVIAEVQPPLVRLLQQSGFQGVFAKGTELPRCDVQIPLMSVPGILGTTAETIPRPGTYLSADPTLVEHWRRALGDSRKLKVGIAWQGSKTHQGDRVRSIPLALFAPLVQENVQLFSLQKGAGCEQLAQAPFRACITDLADGLHDFYDTAAVMRNLDLVITCDSAPAHLAGALGVRVWVALAFAPDWRWQYEREDTPWYPTMRLFRQTTFDDWPSVLERLAQALRRAARKSR